MHAAYPYTDELIAVAKHCPNVWVDLCRAWSIDPFTTADFVSLPARSPEQQAVRVRRRFVLADRFDVEATRAAIRSELVESAPGG